MGWSSPLGTWRSDLSGEEHFSNTYCVQVLPAHRGYSCGLAGWDGALMERMCSWTHSPRARSYRGKTTSGTEGVCKEDKMGVPGQSDRWPGEGQERRPEEVASEF